MSKTFKDWDSAERCSAVLDGAAQEAGCEPYESLERNGDAIYDSKLSFVAPTTTYLVCVSILEAVGL